MRRHTFPRFLRTHVESFHVAWLLAASIFVSSRVGFDGFLLDLRVHDLYSEVSFDARRMVLPASE